MFYLTYLRQELRRRLGRTILTVLGLAVGVALVVAVTALGAGLDQAQSQVLGPLSGVATDLTVTKRPVPFADRGAVGGAAGGPVALERGPLETDLSKLGDPGDHFETDSFSQPQPSFDEDDAKKIADADGVSTTSRALLLQGIHQEGTIPKITAEVETGGEEITQAQDIEPMTDEEQESFQRCMDENAPDEEQGVQPGPGGGRFAAVNECLPERFRRQIQTFRVPRQVIEQDVNTPETDIRSSSYTIAGIEPDSEINLITPSQVTDGRYLRTGGESLVSESYAQDNDLKVGSTLKLKDESYEVVGLVQAPLSGNAADIYLTLGDLQKLSDREGEANVLLVRTTDASKVSSVSGSISDDVPGTNVSDASDLAEQVAGSLVDSGNLIRRLGLVLAFVGVIAAVLIAALLTLSSVAKRTRELGTLKAIGWRPALVVRQILAESAAQGVLGGILGVALGFGAVALLSSFAPSLTARRVGGGGPGVFGLGRLGEQSASEVVKLTAPVSMSMVFLAAGLAVLAGLVAGAIGAMRAARLRPADAMREVS